MILPGSTLGMLGGGQLGRMFTIAARTLGYRVIVLDPDRFSPAGSIADRHLCADYHDEKSLKEMSAQCAAITTEFENVPADVLDYLARFCTVRPAAEAVRTTQDRIHEKSFFQEHQLPTNRFAVVHQKADLEKGFEHTGPAILKRSRFGYDGKAQVRVATLAEAIDAFEKMGSPPCVLEERLDFSCEVSVVLARSASGTIRTYPTAENIHVHGILDTTIVPARVPERVSVHAQQIAVAVGEKLSYTGVLAVEMFVMPDERVLLNEIAPRPHNSGHYTIDACVTDQFEQQVRILAGFEPGDTTLLSPAVMKNILGDHYGDHTPDWDPVLQTPHAKLHLYGKQEARKGRKMGHFTVLERDLHTALADAEALMKRLARVTE